MVGMFYNTNADLIVDNLQTIFKVAQNNSDMASPQKFKLLALNNYYQ